MTQFKGTPHVKAGRCWNGFHKDSGVIVHSVPPQPESVSGPHFEKALCRAVPGRSGYGWVSVPGKEINCSRCKAAINKALNVK
jgi:hypothetical protein